MRLGRGKEKKEKEKNIRKNKQYVLYFALALSFMINNNQSANISLLGWTMCGHILTSIVRDTAENVDRVRDKHPREDTL
jgi:hypothetical protein